MWRRLGVKPRFWFVPALLIGYSRGIDAVHDDQFAQIRVPSQGPRTRRDRKSRQRHTQHVRRISVLADRPFCQPSSTFRDERQPRAPTVDGPARRTEATSSGRSRRDREGIRPSTTPRRCRRSRNTPTTNVSLATPFLPRRASTALPSMRGSRASRRPQPRGRAGAQPAFSTTWPRQRVIGFDDGCHMDPSRYRRDPRGPALDFEAARRRRRGHVRNHGRHLKHHIPLPATGRDRRHGPHA